MRIATIVALAVLLLCSCKEADPSPPARVAALGDSITVGAGLPPEQAWPRLLAPAAVIVQARNGASTQTALAGLLDPQAMAAAHPSVIVVMLGTNDRLQKRPLAGFEGDYGTVLDRICAVMPTIPVLAVGEYDLDAEVLHARYPDVVPVGPHESQAVFVAAIRRAAVARGVGVADMTAVAVELGPDGVHPDVAGQQTIARFVATHLSDASRCGKF